MSFKEIPEIKVILLGETGVGKTSIIKRYAEDNFDVNESSSIGCSYVDKDVQIDKKKYKLIIWDTIGQEAYRSISKSFVNEAKIVILIYSVTDQNSFQELDFWYNLYTEILGNDVILGIAGNKSDLYLEQKVPYEKGKKFADEKRGIFSEISAKENKESINLFMMDLVKAYVYKGKKDLNERKNRIKLDRKDIKKNKAGCCLSKKSEGNNDNDS